MRKILLLNNTTDHDNWGSQATGYTIEEIIKANLEHIEINHAHSHWVLQNYFQRPLWMGGKQITTRKSIIDHYTRPIYFLPTVADEFETYADEWDNSNLRPVIETKRFLETNDDIVFNAEGSTYRNNYSSQRCLYTLWYAKTRMQKRGYFLNGMVHLTDIDSRMPGYVKRTFNELDGIAIREPYSLRSAEKYDALSNGQLVPDAVFYYANNYHLVPKGVTDAFKKLKDSLNGKDYFCFSLSMLPVDYRKNPDKSALLELIMEIKKVIPNAVIMAKDNTDQFLKDLAKRTDSIFFGVEYNHFDLFELLKDAKVLLSGRYHHVIMAAIVGTPSVPFTTTSHKMQGLVELLDCGLHYPFDATFIRPDIENIINESQKITKNTELKEMLVERSKYLGEEAMKMGAMMKL